MPRKARAGYGRRRKRRVGYGKKRKVAVGGRRRRRVAVGGRRRRRVAVGGRRRRRVAVGGRRRHRRMRGGNIFSDAWSGIKKAGRAVYDHVLKPGWEGVRKHKLLSKGLSLLPDPRAKAAAALADKLGYGRRRMRGRSIYTPRRPIGINPMYHLGRGRRRPMRGGASSLSGRMFLV